MNLEEQMELKQAQQAKRNWMGLAIAAILFLAGYAYITTTTLHEAIIYESYKPMFENLANNTLKVVPSYYTCSNLNGFAPTWNTSYIVNETSGT